MSYLLRLSSTLRGLRTSQFNTKIPTNFFSSSHTSQPLNLARSRHYSNYRGNNSNSYRSYEAQIKANNIVLYTLMGTNIAVFGYAMYLKQQAQQGFQAPFIRFFQKTSLNLSDFKNGAYLPIFTAAFVHLDFFHLFSNMFTVYFLGSFLTSAPVITPLRFLTIALGSGISGSLGYLMNRSYQLQSRGPGARDHTRGLGFSGVVMGISTVAACLAPHAKVAIYGIIPMPLWALVAGYAVYDGYYLNSADTRIGHAGHLGGLAFGLVYYFARLRGLR
jgi:membrane associated rhomboid family serine protease